MTQLLLLLRGLSCWKYDNVAFLVRLHVICKKARSSCMQQHFARRQRYSRVQTFT
jgi:hypothetical protein